MIISITLLNATDRSSHITRKLLSWKNAQKTERKNKASDTINKATPKLSPRWTALV